MAKFAATLLAVLALYPRQSLASVQYCHEDKRVPVRFYLATETAFNSSTASTDVRLTFGYQRSSYGGWTAVGIGSEMRGAMIFVGYLSNTAVANFGVKSNFFCFLFSCLPLN